MSTTGTLGILLVALAALTCRPPSPTPAGANAPAADSGADIRGTITRIAGVEPGAPGPRALGRILVEGEVEPDTRYDQGWITVTEETRLVRRDAAGGRPPSFQDLAVGQRVEVTFAGPPAKSLPLQAVGREIVLLDAAGGETASK